MRPASHFYARSGKPRCAGQLRWTQARRFELMTLVDRGLSDDEIAKHFGVTPDAIHLTRKRYGIGSVMRYALSARDVADAMGVGCSKVVTRWIDEKFLAGRRIRTMGPHRGWMVQRDALYAFVEDERTWHLWTPERITDRHLRRYAEQVRGNVQFLTTGDVAERLYCAHTTVQSWIAKGYLPARRWGNWWIDERDLARFELPQIGGGNRKAA